MLDVTSSIRTSGSLFVGSIALSNTGTSNATSGAWLVGAYDEFDYSSSGTVQDVLDDLDAALLTIAGGTTSGSTISKWTDGGAITYLTATGDAVAMGGSTSAAPFYFDAPNGLLTLTNTAAGNSFVVNDQASDGTPLVIDASGNVGVGTSS